MPASQKIIISVPRNAAILVVPVLVLGILYYFGVYKKPLAPQDGVKVIVDDQLRSVLEDCKSKLESVGVNRPAFADKNGNLRVTSLDGTPIKLCGPGSEADKSGQRSCKLVASSAQLVSALSDAASSDQGSCFDLLGNIHTCHKSTGKYDFNFPLSAQHWWCKNHICS